MPRFRDPDTGRFISDASANTLAVRDLNAQLGQAVDRFEAMGRSIPTQPLQQFDEGLLVGTAALVGMNAALQDVIGSQIESAVQSERQQVSLQTITGSVEAATAQYNRLLEVARLPGINISQALRGSAQLQAIGLDGARAAEAIGAIGNALATSGQSAQEMTPIISGFRQLNAEGKILQEDLAIITTRIPALIPLMREAFGGTRAEDVRKFYESIGEADRQTELFSERLIEMLQTLPTISDTAGNALENLEDTAERLQARIGNHLLPSVKSAATGLEDVLKAIENSQGATKSIAVFGSFAGTLLSIVTAGASVRGALLLLRPLLPALLGGPWGIAIAAVGALTAGFVGWRVATSEAREEVKNLNTFIAQNSELLEANAQAIESGSLAELRASETTIRKARDAAQARVEQLQESAKAQFNELRGIKRSGEAFDELSGSLRQTSSDLEKAEAELQRLNTTLKTTNEEADALEKFEANVNNLKTAIEELNAASSSEGIGRILRGDGADIRGSQSNLIKVADAIIADLDTYNQIAEAARGGDEGAIENLRTLQTSLMDAAQSYLEALQGGLSEASSADDFESIIDLADNFEDAFGNVDFLQSLTAEFIALSNAAVVALEDYEQGLKATQAAIDELKRIESQKPGSPLEASEFRRRLQAAEQELTDRLKAEQAAAKERERSQRANLRLGEQLDKKATEIFKEQAEERTDAVEDEIDKQQDAREAQALEREAAADRVADREQQRRDDEVKAAEKAERDKTRIAEREARRRQRIVEREARQLYRDVGSGFAEGLASALESDLIGDAVLGSLRAGEGEMIAFLTDTFGAGAIAGFGAAAPFLTNFFSGLFESLSREDNLDLGAPGITEAQLSQGQFGRLRGERYFNEFGSQFDLQGLAAGLPSIEALDVNILDVPDALKREPLTANELIQIYDRYRIPHNLERTAENTRDSNVSFNTVTELLRGNLDDVRRLLRDDRDSPLQDIIDNRQGLLRLFSAEEMQTFLVGANEWVNSANELVNQQRREQDPEFALLDDLEILLRTAEVESAGAISAEEIDQLLSTLRDALAADEGLTSEAAIAALTDLREVLSRADILPETIDAFTRRFFDEFITDGLEIAVGEIPEEILVAVDTEGVLLDVDPDAEVGVDTEGKFIAVDPDAEVSLEDDAKAGIDPDATVPVEAQTFINALRSFFQESGLPASVYEPFLQSLEQQLKAGTITLTDEAGNAITEIPLVDAQGNTIGTLSLTKDSVELKKADGTVISSVSLAKSDGTEISSIPLVDAAGNPIGTLALTKDSVELKDAAGNVISSLSLTDANGEPITSVGLTDADGNPIATIHLTDGEGNPLSTVSLTDAQGNQIASLNLTDAQGNALSTLTLTDTDGNAITSVDLKTANEDGTVSVQDKIFTVDGTDFLAQLGALIRPPTELTPEPTTPAMEPESILGLESGNPIPTQEEVDRLSLLGRPEIANAYPDTEISILNDPRVGEGDSTLPISAESLAQLTQPMILQEPLKISDESLMRFETAADVEGKTVNVEAKTDLPIKGEITGQVKAEVEGNVNVQGEVTSHIPGVVDVRITDVGSFIDLVADRVTQNISLGGRGIPGD